jgi:hypothetical protein
LARRRQGSGTDEQELDSVFRRRSLWEQSQRPTEPLRSAFRRKPQCCLAGLAEHGDGDEVAMRRRALDMVSTRGRGRTASRERRGTPHVCP